MASARSMFFSCRRRALLLSITLRPDLAFLVMPLAWWVASTVGRRSTDSCGSWAFLRDLSVLILGEVARRAARECIDGPGATKSERPCVSYKKEVIKRKEKGGKWLWEKPCCFELSHTFPALLNNTFCHVASGSLELFRYQGVGSRGVAGSSYRGENFLLESRCFLVGPSPCRPAGETSACSATNLTHVRMTHLEFRRPMSASAEEKPA